MGDDQRPVAVTSGTGRTGRSVVAGLLAAGRRARVLSRTPPTARQVGPEAVRFDWSDHGSHAAAVAGAEVLYVSAPFSVRPDDVGHLLARAVDAGVDRVVLLSALGADELDRLPLGAIEAAVAAAPMATTVLRANWFMENFTHPPLAGWIAGSGELRGCAGDGRVSVVAAADVAAAAVGAMMDHVPTGTWELTGPAALTLHEVAERIGEAAGRPVRYVDLAPDELGALLSDEGVPAPVVPVLVQLFARLAHPDSATLTDHVERLAGRRPSDLAGFAAAHADVWATTGR